MKLLTPFALLTPARRYLSFISGAFDVITFNNNYVKEKKRFLEYFEVGNALTDGSQSSAGGRW